ncbi:hypothetical protein K3N28_05805 [Glycomyces sp. TRM65418]|uniref:hypothetical protein n=1 Tax=Glycomyces sp. TRM65418 TaxID=2867006 RepID=UPI001CE52AAE|nr:hypothetical protein [Glycomyces sp. TRM65418]MCC3762583.1 hypothetical protein [Glycomyces sp. TRM65418]QZD56622.1 hypothetical protein K3N28_05765 [Glycomyces sp. TRM65418]
MAVANCVLAEGRLIQYEPYLPGTDDHLRGMVGVLSPITGRRRVLHAVPVGQTGLIIATLTGPSNLEGTVPLAACAADRPSLVLAAGSIGANTPIPGRSGPADLVGCAPGEGTGPCELRPETEAVLGRLVRLEVHAPGCACKQGLTTVTGPGSRTEVGDG